jgi:hypothetical protein
MAQSDERTVTAFWTREAEAAARESVTVIAPAPSMSDTPDEDPPSMSDAPDEDPPTRVAAAPARDSHTLVIRSPVVPAAPISRPQVQEPPPRLVQPLPAFVRHYAPTIRVVREPAPAPVNKNALRARMALALLGGMAFGAAVLAALIHHGSAARHAQPAPLFASAAVTTVQAAPVETVQPAPAPEPTTVATPEPPTPAEVPPPPPPKVVRAAPSAQAIAFAAATSDAKKKAAKQAELDALLDKLGEEQLKR